MAPNYRDPVRPKLQWIAGIPKQCLVCAVDIYDVEEWMTHMSTHRNSEQLRYGGVHHCPLCAQTSTAYYRIKDHMMRHFLDYKPYQCNEIIPVVDPSDPTSLVMQRCTHREVDRARMNLHCVKCHGHQRQKRPVKRPEESADSGRATRTTRRSRKARKSEPYHSATSRGRQTSETSHSSEPGESSSASSSTHVPSMSQYPALSLAYTGSPSSYPLPTSSSAYSGATSALPAPAPLSSQYAPLPGPSSEASSSSPVHGLYIAAQAPAQPADPLLGLFTAEARQQFEADMDAFFKTLGI